MRILIVDDDRRLCAVIKRGFLEEAYAVDLAYDGEEGEYLAEVNPYNLIILDIMLCLRWQDRGVNLSEANIIAQDRFHEEFFTCPKMDSWDSSSSKLIWIPQKEPT